MTPKQYLDRYTYLGFFSPLNFELVRSGITGYGSGWEGRGDQPNLGAQCQEECRKFVNAVRVAHHGNAHTPCGAKFFFNQQPLGLISPFEDFYADTFTRAFDGKGSPDEITDAMRIATAVGRFGWDKDLAGQPSAAPTAAEYAARFMTIDCNALVGNFYGGNPQHAISYYASPSRARKNGADVRPGDAVVTHCSIHKYEHIGLVEAWSFDGSTATMSLVEWGAKGDESKHFSQGATHAITRGPEKDVGNGIGWPITSPHYGNETFRYVFAPMIEGDSYGWS